MVPTWTQAKSWLVTDWQGACIAGADSACDLGDYGVAIVLKQLETASQTLKSIGFRAPVVQSVDPLDPHSPYVVHLQEGPLAFEGGTASGYYAADDRELSISYGEYFALGDDLGIGTDQGMFTPTHELFHAVQAAYGNRRLFRAAGDEWISEGMAEAIALALADTGTGISSFGTPYLDYPLNNLPSATGDPNDANYVSYLFWLHLAKKYGGRSPQRYSLFHDFLKAAEDHTEPGNSVAIANNAMGQFDPEGFYDIYPDFIAEAGNSAAFYKDVVAIRPAADSSGPEVSQISDTLPALAARAFSVSVPDMHDVDGSRHSAVEIRLDTDDPEALHLIVEDKRYDKTSGPERNVYFEAGDDVDRELLVRVANVARDPAAYKNQKFKLVVTIFREFVEIKGTSAQRDTSGAAAAIDSPIPVSAKVVGRFWGPMRLQSILDAGLDKPCMLQLGTVADDRLISVNLSLLQDGPFRVGEYPIYKLNPIGPNGHYANPPREYLKVSGQAVAEFGLDPKHSLIGDYGMEYAGQGGALTIESISPRWISGIVRIAGAWRGIRPTYLPHDAPPAGPTDVEIEMTFSVSNGSIAKRLDTASCIGPD